MSWFRVSFSSYQGVPQVVPVQVERHTESSVWINGRRKSIEASNGFLNERYVQGQENANALAVEWAEARIARRTDERLKLNQEIRDLEVFVAALEEK